MEKETRQPPEVTIFPIARMRQDYTMNGCTGNFWGHVIRNYRARSDFETFKIVNDAGIILGYVPVEKIDEITAFINGSDYHPCKGHVNRVYDRTLKKYSYYGECVIEKII